MLENKLLAHRNNIAHKRQTAATADLKQLMEYVDNQYAILLDALTWSDIRPGWLAKAVSALNAYTDIIKNLEKSDKFFNWRGDFASSLLPEFLIRIVSQRLSYTDAEPLFSTRGSIVDITLSGYREGGWTIRQKNQDLCIGLRYDVINVDGKEVRFLVPLIAVEAKTNIDINKLNGLDFSAERLKRTFPASKYLLVTETLDFALNNNYAGSIDEIYVLRKQMRSVARRAKIEYSSDVFEEFAEDVAHYVLKADISRTHVYDRLKSGRLINV